MSKVKRVNQCNESDKNILDVLGNTQDMSEIMERLTCKKRLYLGHVSPFQKKLNELHMREIQLDKLRSIYSVERDRLDRESSTLNKNFVNAKRDIYLLYEN